MPISVASPYAHTSLPALRRTSHSETMLLCGDPVQMSSLSGLDVLLFLPAQHRTAAAPARQPSMQHHISMPARRWLGCRTRPSAPAQVLHQPPDPRDATWLLLRCASSGQQTLLISWLCSSRAAL